MDLFDLAVVVIERDSSELPEVTALAVVPRALKDVTHAAEVVVASLRLPSRGQRRIISSGLGTRIIPIQQRAGEGEPHELIVHLPAHPGGPRLRLRCANLPEGFTDTFTSRYIDTSELRLHAVIGGESPEIA